MSNIDTILSNLKTMAIFKLSLGSKELFHSNFIEYLWELDREKVVAIFRILLGDMKFLDGDLNKYELSREKNNFDICLHHRNDKGKIEYDFILENKVKSIPLKSQLDSYANELKEKTKQETGIHYLLLSLAEDFADKKDIEEEKLWKIANYNNLKEAIENQFNCKNDTYTNDYCKFIELMHGLQAKILKDEEFKKSKLFEDVDKFRQCRLHDLYIKLRCYKFLSLLQESLTLKGRPISFLEKYEEVRKAKKGVYLNVNIYQGVGQAAVWIKKGDKYIYEIVIQGDQYRYGINARDLAKQSLSKIGSQENIWGNLIPKQRDFLNKCNFPDHEKKKKGRKIPLNGYGYEYIYRYDKIEKNVEDLLKKMREDIESL